MKNTLFYFIIVFSSLLSVKATEKPTSIPCYVVNEYWPSKIQFEGTIRYSDRPQKTICLTIEGFKAKTASPQEKIDLPFGNIEAIDCDLTNYKAKDDGTLLANLAFNPKSLIKMITFSIRENSGDTWGVLQIVPDVVYG